MATRDVGTIRADSTLVGAAGASVGAWTDLGDRAEALDLERTSTGGTYVLELDWSNDGGSTQIAGSPFTVTPAAGAVVEVPVRARWVRVRVRNTGGAPFTAHTTRVNVRERLRRLRGGGRRRR